MKVCSMCGSQLQDNFNACPNCGNTNFGMMQQPMQNPQVPQQGYQQPMYGQQMPQQGYQQPVYGQQMPQQGYQQPMYEQQMPQQVGGNMPMTYAVVYMVLVGFSVVSNFLSLFTEFNVGTLLGTAFSACVVYFLYKRSKVGRTLAMIQNVLQMIVGALVILCGILFLAGSAVIELDAALSGAFSLVFFILGGGIFAWGICSFIYFKKRACMYIN